MIYQKSRSKYIQMCIEWSWHWNSDNKSIWQWSEHTSETELLFWRIELKCGLSEMRWYEPTTYFLTVSQYNALKRIRLPQFTGLSGFANANWIGISAYVAQYTSFLLVRIPTSPLIWILMIPVSNHYDVPLKSTIYQETQTIVHSEKTILTLPQNFCVDTSR